MLLSPLETRRIRLSPVLVCSRVFQDPRSQKTEFGRPIKLDIRRWEVASSFGRGSKSMAESKVQHRPDTSSVNRVG